MGGLRQCLLIYTPIRFKMVVRKYCTFTNKQTNVASFKRNEGKWFTVTNAVGEALRNGSANGIVIYHSRDKDHYMIFGCLQ